MQIAVARWDVRGIRKEMKRGDRGEQREGETEQSQRELEVVFFSESSVLLTPTSCSSCLPGRGDTVCDMSSDTTKVNKISIWPEE